MKKNYGLFFSVHGAERLKALTQLIIIIIADTTEIS